MVRGLQSNVWTLQSGAEAAGTPIDGLMVPGQSFQMRFQGARISSIQGGCNTMNGSLRLSPQGQLMLGRLAATMKACEPPLMKADAALSAVLAQPLDVVLQPGERPTLRLVLLLAARHWCSAASRRLKACTARPRESSWKWRRRRWSVSAA